MTSQGAGWLFRLERVGKKYNWSYYGANEGVGIPADGIPEYVIRVLDLQIEEEHP